MNNDENGKRALKLLADEMYNYMRRKDILPDIFFKEPEDVIVRYFDCMESQTNEANKDAEEPEELQKKQKPAAVNVRIRDFQKKVEQSIPADICAVDNLRYEDGYVSFDVMAGGRVYHCLL